MRAPGDRWEHGSEFHWLAEGRGAVRTAAQHPWGTRGRFFGCGRDALRALLERGRQQRGWRRIWLPSYFCPEVVAAILSTGLEGVAYPDGPEGDAAPRLDLPFARGDVLLLVNHFGLRAAPVLAAVDRARVEIVEDHTHDPWSPWAWSSAADFAVASLRKTLPLCDGAVLWSPRGETLPDEPPLSETHRRAAEQKRVGMLLKADYLAGASVAKDAFRKLLLAGEREMACGGPSGMTAESRALLDGFPAAAWRATRRENHRYLAALLAGLPGLRLLAPAEPDGCPFAAILRFDSPQQCQAVRRRLIDERIYAAVLWPQSRSAGVPTAKGGRDARAPEDERQLGERLLALHCDVRYNRGDLARVAAAVRRAHLKPESLPLKPDAPPLKPDASPLKPDAPPLKPDAQARDASRSSLACASGFNTGDSLACASGFNPAAMQAALVAPASPRWGACLAAMRHDFYHLPQYARIAARQEGGEPLAFVAEENGRRLLLPLVIRPATVLGEPQPGWSDATSPYGYPSPIVADAHGGAIDAGFLARALQAFRRTLQERRIVSAFVRLHPLLRLPLEPFAECGQLVQHGETVWIDLTLPREELWRQTRPGHRREIDRARRSGAVAAIEGTWRHLDDFCRAYAATMRRVGASPYYHFPREYFCGLRDRLPGVFHLCVVRAGGEFACGGLFSEVDGLVQYHLSASRPESAGCFPTKLMLDFVRNWAKDRGNRALHLGGGLGSADDSLLRFKAGFSRLRAAFHTWRVVADDDAYGSLVEHWRQRTGAPAEGPDGFFPAYRKPLPAEPQRKAA